MKDIYDDLHINSLSIFLPKVTIKWCRISTSSYSMGQQWWTSDLNSHTCSLCIPILKSYKIQGLANWRGKHIGVCIYRTIINNGGPATQSTTFKAKCNDAKQLQDKLVLVIYVIATLTSHSFSSLYFSLSLLKSCNLTVCYQKNPHSLLSWTLSCVWKLQLYLWLTKSSVTLVSFPKSLKNRENFKQSRAAFLSPWSWFVDDEWSVNGNVYEDEKEKKGLFFNQTK